MTKQTFSLPSKGKWDILLGDGELTDTNATLPALSGLIILQWRRAADQMQKPTMAAAFAADWLR